MCAEIHIPPPPADGPSNNRSGNDAVFGMIRALNNASGWNGPEERDIRGTRVVDVSATRNVVKGQIDQARALLNTRFTQSENPITDNDVPIVAIVEALDLTISSFDRTLSANQTWQALKEKRLSAGEKDDQLRSAFYWIEKLVEPSVVSAALDRKFATVADMEASYGPELDTIARFIVEGTPLPGAVEGQTDIATSEFLDVQPLDMSNVTAKIRRYLQLNKKTTSALADRISVLGEVVRENRELAGLLADMAKPRDLQLDIHTHNTNTARNRRILLEQLKTDGTVMPEEEMEALREKLAAGEKVRITGFTEAELDALIAYYRGLEAKPFKEPPAELTPEIILKHLKTRRLVKSKQTPEIVALATTLKVTPDTVEMFLNRVNAAYQRSKNKGVVIRGIANKIDTQGNAV